MFANKTTYNFSGGEVDPSVIARTDIPLYNKVLGWMQNFIAEPAGVSRFRNGTQFVKHTRQNNVAFYIEFQFSDVQSYLIEATKGYFRFLKDGALILNSTALVITGISKADPGVLTYTGTDPTNGQEVYVSGVLGMTQVNGRFFTVANVNAGANTFQLTDVFGDDVDTTGYTTYTSAGTASVVYEVKTPYLEADLETLKFDQNADTMYLTHQNYEPRKLTRTAHASWTLARYTRTSDPFATDNVTYGVITGVTAANPGVVSDAAHTFVLGDHVYITGIVGMVELNDRHFTIGTTGAGTYQLKDYDTGVTVNTTTYTAYVSGGVTEKIGSTTYPAAVGFTDGSRLGLSGSSAKPETQNYSKSPSAAGAVQFDIFTTGTNPSDALAFTLAPLQGKVDAIRWMHNTDKYIALGTFGSVRRVFGASEGDPIAPDAITARSANSDGVHTSAPVIDAATLFYINRSQTFLESLEFDFTVDGYSPEDRNLVAASLTNSGLRMVRRQIGKPTIIWVPRNDGLLLGLTYKGKENIAGWHRHVAGGDGIVEAAGIMPRENAQDQLWLVVKRFINGRTVRYHEYMTDPPILPDFLEFYTDEESKEDDLRRFLNYQSEMVKYANHLDSALVYDGSDYGTNASASITLGVGADVEDTTGVTVTASAAVFNSAMVGRQIWGAYDTDGEGGGRLTITGYTSTTVVTGTIVDPFPAVPEFVAGDWFLTATTLTGLDHLENETVRCVTDGAVPADVFVHDGEITIDQPSSVIYVGFPYKGIMRTLPLDMGGSSGPAQNKWKIVAEVAIRFLNSGGCLFGTTPYYLKRLEFRRGNDYTDRPVPLFTGVERASYADTHDNDKQLYIIQDKPLPCIIQSIDVYMDTTDE